MAYLRRTAPPRVSVRAPTEGVQVFMRRVMRWGALGCQVYVVLPGGDGGVRGGGDDPSRRRHHQVRAAAAWPGVLSYPTVGLPRGTQRARPEDARLENSARAASRIGGSKGMRRVVGTTPPC
jgi:hypothetical protein